MVYYILVDMGGGRRRVLGSQPNLDAAVHYADAIGEEFSSMGVHPQEVCMVVESADDSIRITQTWKYGFIVMISSKGV